MAFVIDVGGQADVNSANVADLDCCISRKPSYTAGRPVRQDNGQRQHVHGQSLAGSSLRGPLSNGCMTALTRGRWVKGAVEDKKFPI